MSIFTPYRYNPATVGACQVTEENLVELAAIVNITKIKVKPRVGEWVIKKENGTYEIWQIKAFERKFSKVASREIHPSSGMDFNGVSKFVRNMSSEGPSSMNEGPQNGDGTAIRSVSDAMRHVAASLNTGVGQAVETKSE